MIRIKIPRIKAGGEWRLITRNPDMRIAQDTGWFPNLVLDSGLINMTTQTSWSNVFHIGNSANPTNVTQTALSGWLAASGAPASSDIFVNLGAAAYQGQVTRNRRFLAGVATDTIREMGLGDSTSNSNLSIRSLVTPEINKAANQILDVFYRFTTWPNLTDATGITNIFGDDYDYTVRIGSVEDLKQTLDAYRPNFDPADNRAYTGLIGSITELPAGTSAESTSITITSQGSGFCNYDVLFNVDDGNIGGIQSIASSIVGGGGNAHPRIQVEFKNRGEGTGALDSPIPKDATREITFNLGITWDRH